VWLLAPQPAMRANCKTCATRGKRAFTRIHDAHLGVFDLSAAFAREGCDVRASDRSTSVVALFVPAIFGCGPGPTAPALTIASSNPC
jgi:hypothetical protein